MKKRVLYVSQEINLYWRNNNGQCVKSIAAKTQENGKDIRIFLPKFGTIVREDINCMRLFVFLG